MKRYMEVLPGGCHLCSRDDCGRGKAVMPGPQYRLASPLFHKSESGQIMRAFSGYVCWGADRTNPFPTTEPSSSAIISAFQKIQGRSSMLSSNHEGYNLSRASLTLSPSAQVLPPTLQRLVQSSSWQGNPLQPQIHTHRKSRVHRRSTPATAL